MIRYDDCRIKCGVIDLYINIRDRFGWMIFGDIIWDWLILWSEVSEWILWSEVGEWMCFGVIEFGMINVSCIFE